MIVEEPVLCYNCGEHMERYGYVDVSDGVVDLSQAEELGPAFSRRIERTFELVEWGMKNFKWTEER